MLPFLGQGTDSSIGECLPTQRGMTVRLMCPHGKRSIEQQHALLSPSREVARGGNGRPEVIVYLLENILQRGRKGDTVLHREAQSVRLHWLMVRVLPDDDHLHSVEGTEVKGIEDEAARWIASVLRVLGTNRIGESDKVGLVELTIQILLPAWFYLDIHHLLSEMRFSPVISAGCSMPRICRMEGATSARRPSFTVAELLSVT